MEAHLRVLFDFLTDDIFGDLSLIGKAIKASWWSYLRPLYRILAIFEEHSPQDAAARRTTRRRGHGLRLFSLLPLSSHRSSYVFVDTMALYDLSAQLKLEVLDMGYMRGVTEESFRADSDTWWKRSFHISKVKTKKRQFARSLSTDGIGVSAGMLRPISSSSGIEDYGWRWEGEGRDRHRAEYVPWGVRPEDGVVGLDPGRRTLLSTTAGGLDMSLDNGGLAEYGTQWSLSLKSWKHLAGMDRDARKQQLWMKNHAEVPNTLRDLPSFRSASLDGLRAALLSHSQSYSWLATFFAARRWRRLRWGAHISREQAYHQVALRLSAGRPRTFLAFGDGAFSSSSRGHAPGPVKMMFAKLRASLLLHARKVREYRTSRVCSKCHGEFSGRHKAWAIKECRSVCRTWWNRGVNASRNVLQLALHQEENEGARMLVFDTAAATLVAEAEAGRN